MAEKAITIYTPSDVPPHITAEDDAFIYDSIFEGCSGILGDLSCTASGSNVVLQGGGVSNCGYILRIPKGQSVTLTPQNVAQGMIRVDAVVSQFTKGGGNVADSHVITLVSGTASASLEMPVITESELQNSGDVNQVVLFYLTIYQNEVIDITRAALSLPFKEQSRKIYVQQNEPSQPNVGDLWFW